MATYNQLIFDTLEDLKKNHVSSHVDIDYRQIIYKYDQQRELWLGREFSKPGSLVESYLISKIGCLELQVSNPIECCIEADCKILRTKKKLPRFISKSGKPLITSLLLAGDYKTNLSLVEHDRLQYVTYGKYKPNKPIAFIYDGYLFIQPNSISDMMLEGVYLQGVIADTLLLEEYNKCDNGACFSLDDQYPFDGEKLAYIKQYVKNEFIGSIQMPNDTINDSRDKLEK